jgi:hypothetical protein
LSPPLVEPDQHDHDRDRDRHHRDPQRDQDVGGQPENAAVILGPDLLDGSSWSLGAGSGRSSGVLKAPCGLWSQRSGMDRLLSSEVELAASRHPEAPIAGGILTVMPMGRDSTLVDRSGVRRRLESRCRTAPLGDGAGRPLR